MGLPVFYVAYIVHYERHCMNAESGEASNGKNREIAKARLRFSKRTLCMSCMSWCD